MRIGVILAGLAWLMVHVVACGGVALDDTPRECIPAAPCPGGELAGSTTVDACEVSQWACSGDRVVWLATQHASCISVVVDDTPSGADALTAMCRAQQ